MSSLICRTCGAAYDFSDARWRCQCGSVIDVEYEPSFDRNRITSGKPTMWRYRQAIPILNDANMVSLDEGFTPLLEISFDGRSVLVKQDQLCPTGSFKDRGASVLVSRLRELGIARVVEDSSGNAGCALAAYSARAGIDCTVFVPEDIGAAGLRRIRRYGAKVVIVAGGRQEAARQALDAAGNAYYASHSWNPFFLQGTKTFAFEVCEQLGWAVPDVVVLPVGNGTLLLGVDLGFKELAHLGVIGRIPKLIGVQSARCAPLYHAFQAGRADIPPVEPEPTMARGIAVPSPVRGQQIIRAVGRSGGWFIAVEDAAIAESLRDITRLGFSVEPTAAAGIAGLRQFLKHTPVCQLVVSAFTGGQR
jgi:threonine synthase